MAYEFTLDSFRTFSDDIIGANGDQATITSRLADMQDAFTDSIARLTKAEHDAEEIGKENERLRQANLDLFLRVGESARTPQVENNPKDEHQQSTAEYMQSYFDKLEDKK